MVNKQQQGRDFPTFAQMLRQAAMPQRCST
jgi:hypothetical protein